MNRKMNRSVRHILRYAQDSGGKVCYETCMYSLGFTDTVLPPTRLNEELSKFGRLHYAEDASVKHKAWHYFEINEEGRRYLSETEPKGFAKVWRTMLSAFLSCIQMIPLAEGWISYVLGSILASLFTPLSFLALLWYPIDILFKAVWMVCDYLKHQLWSLYFTWSASSHRWERHFPVL